MLWFWYEGIHKTEIVRLCKKTESVTKSRKEKPKKLKLRAHEGGEVSAYVCKYKNKK